MASPWDEAKGLLSTIVKETTSKTDNPPSFHWMGDHTCLALGLKELEWMSHKSLIQELFQLTDDVAKENPNTQELVSCLASQLEMFYTSTHAELQSLHYYCSTILCRYMSDQLLLAVDKSYARLVLAVIGCIRATTNLQTALGSLPPFVLVNYLHDTPLPTLFSIEEQLLKYDDDEDSSDDSDYEECEFLYGRPASYDSNSINSSSSSSLLESRAGFLKLIKKEEPTDGPTEVDGLTELLEDVEMPTKKKRQKTVLVEDGNKGVEVPEGWQRMVLMRTNGMTSGTFDVYYTSPLGKKLRSKREMEKYCLENGLKIDLSVLKFNHRADGSKKSALFRKAVVDITTETEDNLMESTANIEHVNHRSSISTEEFIWSLGEQDEDNEQICKTQMAFNTLTSEATSANTPNTIQESTTNFESEDEIKLEQHQQKPLKRYRTIAQHPLLPHRLHASLENPTPYLDIKRPGKSTKIWNTNSNSMVTLHPRKHRNDLVQDDNANKNGPQLTKLGMQNPVVPLQYTPKQWSPQNPTGRRMYDIVFLRNLRYTPHSMQKPPNLPKCFFIHDEVQTGYMSRHPVFTKNTAKSSILKDHVSSADTLHAETKNDMSKEKINGRGKRSRYNSYEKSKDDPIHLAKRSRTSLEANASKMQQRFQSMVDHIVMRYPRLSPIRSPVYRNLKNFADKFENVSHNDDTKISSNKKISEAMSSMGVDTAATLERAEHKPRTKTFTTKEIKKNTTESSPKYNVGQSPFSASNRPKTGFYKEIDSEYSTLEKDIKPKLVKKEISQGAKIFSNDKNKNMNFCKTTDIVKTQISPQTIRKKPRGRPRQIKNKY